MIVSRLSLTYPGPARVLQQISFRMNSGCWLGITGSNGSGKTSLLYCLAGLIPRHLPGRLSGKISLAKQPGLMFQNPDFSLFNLTVEEEAGFGASGDVLRALKTVGLDRLRQADPHTLSYGQKQKLCLAGLLARNPRVLLLDEPASMLDYHSTLELYRLLARLNRQGKTIVTVEHDTRLLWEFTRRILILDQGKIAAFGPTRTVLKNTRLLRRLGLRPL